MTQNTFLLTTSPTKHMPLIRIFITHFHVLYLPMCVHSRNMISKSDESRRCTKPPSLPIIKLSEARSMDSTLRCTKLPSDLLLLGEAGHADGLTRLRRLFARSAVDLQRGSCPKRRRVHHDGYSHGTLPDTLLPWDRRQHMCEALLLGGPCRFLRCSTRRTRARSC